VCFTVRESEGTEQQDMRDDKNPDVRGTQSTQGEGVRGEDNVTAGVDDKIRVPDKGKRAAASGRYQGSSGRSREDEDLTDISSQADAAVDHKLINTDEDLVEDHPDAIESLNLSDTDEDENEGLGDGRIGRTVRGDLK